MDLPDSSASMCQNGSRSTMNIRRIGFAPLRTSGGVLNGQYLPLTTTRPSYLIYGAPVIKAWHRHKLGLDRLSERWGTLPGACLCPSYVILGSLGITVKT